MILENKYIKERWNKLITFDKIRIYKLLENLQYAFLYILITLPLSGLVEDLFPDLDKNKYSYILFLEIVLQCLIIVIMVFYIQKIVKLIPVLFPVDKNYKKYRVSEYDGVIIISLIFVGTQNNLINKIRELRNRLLKSINSMNLMK
jgi:hypothetical protein